MGCGHELAELLFDSVQAGVLVIEAASKKIIYVNPIAAVFIGRRSSDIIGHTCESILCQQCDKFCQCSVIGNGPAFKEIKIERADGTIKYAEFGVVSRIYKDNTIYVITLIDITEKKETELLLEDVWNKAKQVLIRNLEEISQ